VKKVGNQIVIRLDAGHRRGMGHLFRMMTLAQMFEKGGYRCVFLIRKNKATEKILRSRQYPLFISYAADITEDHIVASYLQQHTPPLLWLFDLLSTSETWVKTIRQNNVPVVCFDDLSGGPKAANLVINAIAGCWGNSPRGDNIIGGPQYIILNPDIGKLKNESPLLTAMPPKIGISMGGSDTHGATVKIAQALVGAEFGELYFFIGPNFEHEKELMGSCSRLICPFYFKKNLLNLLNELVKMDLVICNGGQTLFELFALGVPAVAIANEPHEEKTIRYFADLGACLNLGAIQKGIGFISFRNTLQEIVASSDRTEVLRKTAQGIVDGKGAFRCYNECLKLIIT
jgi:spore coat polysaccharide biosynthesis predicted glycosyltransferase SpsG